MKFYAGTLPAPRYDMKHVPLYRLIEKTIQQVLIQYDLDKSNAELALDYGIIESKSERNAYTLTLEISESDPFFGDKLDIAETNGLGETAYFDIVLGRPLPPALIPYLRLVALGGTDAFLLESIFRNTIWGHLELPVSRANEELICRVVRDACKSALSGYCTTIEEVKLYLFLYITIKANSLVVINVSTPAKGLFANYMC